VNFYSYSPQTGMQYHPTKEEAKGVADKALRHLLHNMPHPDIHDDVLNTITWGEVRERAASVDGNPHTLRNQLRLTYEEQYPQVIDGRMVNGNDDLVLVKNIHDVDLLYHNTVLTIAAIWKDLSARIARFKQHNFEDVTTMTELIFEKYSVKRGGKHGNMVFSTFDRKFKLLIAIQNKIDFGPEFQAAERKLRDALKEMTPDSATDLQTLVTAAFSLDSGSLRVSEVLRLRSYKIENPLWNEGIQIINQAIIVISKKKQIRLQERNAAGEYVNIPLDIAAL